MLQDSRFAPKLPSRIPSLDGLRAVSILLVVVGHSINAEAHPKLFSLVGHIGNYGVRMFFVISGFLITTLLLKEWDKTGAISIKNFYIRRTLRIIPAFLVFVGVVYGLSLAGIIDLNPGDMLHTLTYTVNYHMDRGWYINHIWSLSVEEQFYLLWPAALLLATPRRGLQLAGATILLAPIIRTVMYFGFDASATALSRHFQAVCDALAFGCVLAGIYNWLGRQPWYLRLSRPTLFLAIPFFCMLLPAVAHKIHPMLFYVPGVSLAYFGMTLILDHSVRHPQQLLGRILDWAPLRFIGVISYSLYLWQEVFLDNGVAGLKIPFPQNVILAFVVSIASYYLIEKQFLRIKDRFSSSHAVVVRDAAVS